jgi:hypothetical protein
MNWIKVNRIEPVLKASGITSNVVYVNLDNVNEIYATDFGSRLVYNIKNLACTDWECLDIEQTPQWIMDRC